jgi:S1-C subfamily serine protease
MGGFGGRSAPGGLDAIGGMLKFLGAMIGVQPNFAVRPRGFLGAELAEADGGVVVKSVIPDGPAGKAGIKQGDVVTDVGDAKLGSLKDATRIFAGRAEGESLAFTVRRGDKESIITVELGRGL